MIKVGFIGTGGISGVHLRYLKSRQDVELAALCDVKADNLERRQKEFGGKPYSDYRAMLDQTKLDAVYLCTPPLVRGEPLLACAERGIPVFCEKPVERDLARAEATAAALTARQGHVQIGYVFRAMPVIQRLRDAWHDDHIHLFHSFYGCNMSLSRSLASWFFRKEISGGALVDQATHNLDLLRALLGELTDVRGQAGNPVHEKKEGYTVEEVFALSFRFAGGVGAHVHTWVGDGWRNEIVFTGEKRLYRLNLGQGQLTVESGAETTTFRQDQGKTYEHQNEAFLAAVESGDWSRNPCDYVEGTKSLALTLACDRAVCGA